MPRFNVSQAAPHELLAACRLLFSDGHAEARRDYLLSDSHTCGVLVARSNEGKLHAATLVQVLPGALGVAWPPRGDSAEALDAATTAACEWLRSQGVKVCQAYAPASAAADMTSLERCGFRRVTQLLMLRREIDSSLDAATPFIRLKRWLDKPTAEQLQVLLATHEGTLDCPELNDARTPDEILAGFRPTVLEDRSWWSAFDDHGALVGVVLFEGGESGMLEVSYLGLIPAARGRGLAGPLLRFADQVAVAENFQAIHVSVDGRNTPAVKLYTRHGFVRYDCREVWLAVWPR